MSASSPSSTSFDLTRVINLRDRKDRFQAMGRQLDRLGMPFARGRVEVFSASRVNDPQGFPGAGVRGCFLSHLAILKDAKARGVESVLVMEDDLEVFPEDAPHLNRLLTKSLGRDWGIVYFGHIQRLEMVDEPRLIPYQGAVGAAHCYAVHAPVFDRLIEYLEGCLVRPPGDPIGGPMHYDGALTMFRAANPDVVTLIAQPSLASQRSSRSDISYRSWERIVGIKQLMGWLRTARRVLQPRRKRLG